MVKTIGVEEGQDGEELVDAVVDHHVLHLLHDVLETMDAGFVQPAVIHGRLVAVVELQLLEDVRAICLHAS